MAEIGSIGIGAVNSVSSSGQIGFLNADSVLHWGVRADDRWHIARDERAIRQGIAEDGVSIETRLRVPGGDIVHRASSTPFKDSSLVVVEVENETPVPIALALFVNEKGVWKRKGETLNRDQIPFVRANKSISDFRLAASEADLFRLVKSELNQSAEGICGSEEGSYVAIIFPLPHASVLRFVLRSEPSHNPLPSPDDLPSLDGIANGWHVHFSQGAVVDVHDGRLQNALLSARRHLLLGSGQSPTSPYWRRGVPTYTSAIAVVAMCMWGHNDASKRLLLQLINDQPITTFRRPDIEETCYLLWACNEFILMQQDDEIVEAVSAWATEQIGRLLELIPRWARRIRDYSFLHLGLESSVSLLQRAHREEEAQQLEAALPKIYKRSFISFQQGSLPSALLDREQSSKTLLQFLNTYIGDSQGVGSFDESMAIAETTSIFASDERLQDPLASAVFLLALRRALVSQPIREIPITALLPDYDSRWFNVPIEVSGMPTRNGKIGYALRWHGNRPAILWEGESNSEVTIVAPGLDAGWQSFESRGEALFPEQKPQETPIPLISPAIQKSSNPPPKPQSGNAHS